MATNIQEYELKIEQKEWKLLKSEGNIWDVYETERPLNEGADNVVCIHRETKKRFTMKKIVLEEIEDWKSFVLQINAWKELRNSDLVLIVDIYEDF